MTGTIKKKRPKVSGILGQTSKDAESALLGNGKKINFQNSKLESITAESALMPKSQEIKMRSPRFEKLSANSAVSFTQKLNAMIAAGVSFDVGADNFQAFGASERERQALDAHRKETLCTLQQMFLQKHLFSESPELLESFKTEVNELSAIMTDGGEEIIFEAVCKICADWIEEAIENNG